jgi:hypothetical protein
MVCAQTGRVPDDMSDESDTDNLTMKLGTRTPLLSLVGST